MIPWTQQCVEVARTLIFQVKKGKTLFVSLLFVPGVPANTKRHIKVSSW